jgi:hypothetical protein
MLPWQQLGGGYIVNEIVVVIVLAVNYTLCIMKFDDTVLNNVGFLHFRIFGPPNLEMPCWKPKSWILTWSSTKCRTKLTRSSYLRVV